MPGFCFMAEVYWDLEWTLQQQGFDYTYDKRLYDRLRDGHARPVREHFWAGLEYQDKLARFLENHDEPRAAATFSPDVHKAAAVITFLSPGLRFFLQGEFRGARKHLAAPLSGPNEPTDPQLEQFYRAAGRAQATGRAPRPVAITACVLPDGNWTWTALAAGRAPVENGCRQQTGPNQSQCYVRLPFADLGHHPAA
jgi:glycosidase